MTRAYSRALPIYDLKIRSLARAVAMIERHRTPSTVSVQTSGDHRRRTAEF